MQAKQEHMLPEFRISVDCFFSANSFHPIPCFLDG
jgi:hypothetical protein